MHLTRWPIVMFFSYQLLQRVLLKHSQIFQNHVVGN